jgi:antitoxin component HigA of HigAB toxin-antitoxin module
MKTKLSLTFNRLPKDYAGLCRILLPRPIHDKVSYENTVEVADSFAGFEHQMSQDQSDYFDLLCDLIEKHDNEILHSSELSPLELLKHLIHEHALTGADLSRILGKSLSLGPLILRGERKITAAHAVRLGQHFALQPAAFLFPDSIAPH